MHMILYAVVKHMVLHIFNTADHKITQCNMTKKQNYTIQVYNAELCYTNSKPYHNLIMKYDI